MCAVEQQTHIDCLLTVSRIHVTAAIAAFGTFTENVDRAFDSAFDRAFDRTNVMYVTVKLCLLCHTNVFDNRLLCQCQDGTMSDKCLYTIDHID